MTDTSHGPPLPNTGTHAPHPPSYPSYPTSKPAPIPPQTLAHSQPTAPSNPSQPTTSQYPPNIHHTQPTHHKHKHHHHGRKFKQGKAPKQDEPDVETYPLGTPMPYEYKAKEWQKKTPKMVVIEYFQRYQVKDSLKWERINLPSSKKHLVKCIFPAEFGSKEFVPNRTWNSVKDAEHNTAILALLYLNSVPEGSGNQEVKVPLSDFVPPPLPVTDNTRKQMAYLKYRPQGPGFKRKAPDSGVDDNPNRIGVGQYSAVPPPEQFKQQQQQQRLVLLQQQQQVFNQVHQQQQQQQQRTRLAYGTTTYTPPQPPTTQESQTRPTATYITPTSYPASQYVYPSYPTTAYQAQQLNTTSARPTTHSATIPNSTVYAAQYFPGVSNTNYTYGYTPPITAVNQHAQTMGYYPVASQFSVKR